MHLDDPVPDPHRLGRELLAERRRRAVPTASTGHSVHGSLRASHDRDLSQRESSAPERMMMRAPTLGAAGCTRVTPDTTNAIAIMSPTAR